MSAPIGLLVNPRSGRDVRRVVASAGQSTLEDKISIVRRVVFGARSAGATQFITNGEPHRIVERATDTIGRIAVATADVAVTGTEADTTAALIAMREAGCAVVVVLGGDGTNRAVARGWRDAPVLPLSTGTNNAFPYYAEPTAAGQAVGLVASGAVDLESVSRRAKLISVDGVTEDGGPEHDIALIDAVAVDDPFVGSLELFDPDTMRLAVLTRADPAAVGFSSIGGLVHPVTEADDHGLVIRFGNFGAVPTMNVHAPTAPGFHSTVPVASIEVLAFDEPVTLSVPTVLAFDGERKRRVHEGETVTLRVRRDGPRVLDVAAVMAQAAATGHFVDHLQDL